MGPRTWSRAAGSRGTGWLAPRAFGHRCGRFATMLRRDFGAGLRARAGHALGRYRVYLCDGDRYRDHSRDDRDHRRRCALACTGLRQHALRLRNAGAARLGDRGGGYDSAVRLPAIAWISDERTPAVVLVAAH